MSDSGRTARVDAIALTGLLGREYRELLELARQLEMELNAAREEHQRVIDYVMGYFPVGMCYVDSVQAISVVVGRMQDAEKSAQRWEKEAKINAENFHVTNQALVGYDNKRIAAEKRASLAEASLEKVREKLKVAVACIEDADSHVDMPGWWKGLYAFIINDIKDQK